MFPLHPAHHPNHPVLKLQVLIKAPPPQLLDGPIANLLIHNFSVSNLTVLGGLQFKVFMAELT